MSLVLRIPTKQSAAIISARLAKTVAPRRSVWSIKPVKIQAWLAQYENKSFVGSVENGRFKLVLLRAVGGTKLWRSNSVVLVGTIENEVVNALLRPPIFNAAFAALFTIALTIGFTLSYYGPSNTATVRLLLAAMWILPMTVLIWTFYVEARLVEKTLRWALAEPTVVE